MNLSVLQAIPSHGVAVSRPILVNPKGNLYKMKINHYDGDNTHVRDYEVWATKEAVQKHFNGITEDPNAYQLKKFAHQMYNSRLKETGGNPVEKGAFMSSSQKIHGNPTLWPRAIIDPEMKV